MNKIKFSETFFELLDNELQPIPIQGRSAKKETDQKKPLLTTWEPLQTEILENSEASKLLDGYEVRGCKMYGQPGAIGIVTGKPSGNLEAIDIDVKNDPTGTIAESYFELIKSNLPGVYETLTIQKTPSNGYHILYRCPRIGTIDTSHKLASSKTGETIIETRGQNGYIVTSPSKLKQGDYKLIQGTYDSIPNISPETRTTLLAMATSLNEFRQQEPPQYEYSKTKSKKTKADQYDITSLDDYDQRGDVLELLYELKWTHVETKPTRDGSQLTYLLRPTKGKESEAKHSANYHHGHRTLTIFSTSVPEADQYEAYRKRQRQKRKSEGKDVVSSHDRTLNPSSVFCFFKCQGDWTRTAKELGELGYGRLKSTIEDDIEDLGDEIRVKVKNEESKKRILDAITKTLNDPTASETHKKISDKLKEAYNKLKSNDIDGVRSLAYEISELRLDDNDIFDIFTRLTTYEDDSETIKNLPPSIDTGYYIGKQKYSLVSSAINTIAGYTGHLKSTFMLNLAYNTARDNPDSSVLYVSLEQPSWKLRTYLTQIHISEPNLLVNGANFDEAIQLYKKTDGKDLSLIKAEHRDKFQKKSRELFSEFIESGRIKVVDHYGKNGALTNIDSLCLGLRSLKDKQKPKLILIDYVQNLELPTAKDIRQVQRYEQYKVFCSSLEKLANDTGVPIALGCQYNREAKNHYELTKENLAESNEIEKKSDNIIALWNNDITPKPNKGQKRETIIEELKNEGRYKPGTLYATYLKSRVSQPETWGLIPMEIRTRRILSNVPTPSKSVDKLVKTIL